MPEGTVLLENATDSSYFMRGKVLPCKLTGSESMPRGSDKLAAGTSSLFTTQLYFMFCNDTTCPGKSLFTHDVVFFTWTFMKASLGRKFFLS